MKRHEALPGKYLAKEDFDPPRVVAVKKIQIEEVKGENTTENKPILYLAGIDDERGIVLNGTNWDTLAEITGSEDSDGWTGQTVEIYHDPTIKFGRKTTGGIRIRQAPAGSEAPSSDDTHNPPF